MKCDLCSREVPAGTVVKQFVVMFPWKFMEPVPPIGSIYKSVCPTCTAMILEYSKHTAPNALTD